MADTNELMIEVKGLRNQFGSHVVHDDLNLEVRRGEILCVVGGSGSGKSVLMRSIIGLHKPTHGKVIVNGTNLADVENARRQAVERSMGVLFQKGALYSSLSVLENLMLPLQEFTELTQSDMRDLAVSKLTLVGLNKSVANNSVQSLSGGMVKRAALARALILEPQLLFLDEPTAGLDPIGADDFDELLLTIQQALGLTVFLVTHDLDSLHKVSDRIAVLAKRQVLVVDTLQAVAQTDDPWIQSYFNGPRGRAAKGVQTRELARQPHGTGEQHGN